MSLYSQFENNINQMLKGLYLANIAIAVSGGVDSMVLMHLASLWAKKYNKHLTILTVNHNLRPSALVECQEVVKIANKLGCKSAILNWSGDQFTNNIQAEAREGRYSLMTDYCKRNDILVLLTAHHHDDYIENFAIRQKRSSGMLGLSSNYINFVNNVMVLRPLYNTLKQQLLDYAKELNIKWFEDESNNSSKYFRNEVRLKIKQDSAFKLILESELKEINDNAKTLTHKLIANFASIVTVTPLGYAIIDRFKFSQAEHEIKLNILNLVLTIIGGKKLYPRYESVARIIEDRNALNFTLHGCFIENTKENIFIYRDFGRIISEAAPLKIKAKWDNRFKYVGAMDFNDHYISDIKASDYAIIKQFIQKNIPKKAVITSPAIYHLEKLVAIPHISYYNDNYLEDNFELVFEPVFISRFLHFC